LGDGWGVGELSCKNGEAPRETAKNFERKSVWKIRIGEWIEKEWNGHWTF
jgi:hypothetical protein